MKTLELLKHAYAWGPVLFGIGFLAPLIAQTMDAASIRAPAGLATLQTGLVAGFLAGLAAKARGRRWV